MPSAKKDKFFVGVDVGGTKILAALITADGRVLQRERIDTPRQAKPEVVIDVILGAVEKVVAAGETKMKSIAGVGIAIPGVVDPQAGRVIATANMNLGGVEVGPKAGKRLGVPVFLGNDVNLGALGEKWLGTAMDARSVVGIFVGTGIGGAVIMAGHLVTGSRDGAGEIGHMVMDLNGPKCGCGATGCLEALASRSAIDRDIRAAVKDGGKSIIADLVDLDKPTEQIRSGALRKALAKNDPVVTDVVTRAAEVMGLACISIAHLLDPDAFLFGGGVIEACGGFILPIVERVLKSDPLAGDKPCAKVLESSLGDDAGVLGAAAMAQQQLGLDPFARTQDVSYPELTLGDEDLAAAGRDCRGGCLIRADGTSICGEHFDERLISDIERARLSDKTVRQLCRARPHAVFVGQVGQDAVKLTNRARRTLTYHDVALEILPAGDAVKAFNKFEGRKAFLLAATKPKAGKVKVKGKARKTGRDD